MKRTYEGALPDGAIKVNSKSDITTSCRLFYELHGGDKVKTGIWKEIRDVPRFIQQDKRLEDADYIAMHNFYIIIQ